MSTNPRYSVNRRPRHVVVDGRRMGQALRGCLERKLGAGVTVLLMQPFIQAALEEWFYGISLKDNFGDLLRPYSVPTDLVEEVRAECLASVVEQLQYALGPIRPSCQYSFQLLDEDVIVTESPPLLLGFV